MLNYVKNQQNFFFTGFNTDMKISGNIPFMSSQINIVSMADNHGDILGIPQVIETIKKNKEDIFEKSNEKSTANVLSIAGDYFMNPAKKGLLTNPQFSLGDVQYNFLLKLIYDTQMASGNKNNFTALYGFGNHCFGAGDEWLFKKLNRAPMYTLTTNIDLKHSKLKNELEKSKFTDFKILEIPDSKNPKLKNHILFLGVTIPSYYYNPDTIKQIKFYDGTYKNDAAINEEDLKKTIKILRNHVKEFKDTYPDGAVVMLSHMGNKLSQIFAKKIPDINLILNGHDHKEFTTVAGKTLILSHGQNNDFFNNVKIVFDDKGELQFIRNTKYNTQPYALKARKDKGLQEFVQTSLRKDLEPLVYFDQKSGESEEMIFDNTIKYKNNIVANYITSAIKASVKEIYPQVDSVGIPSSVIRNGLKSNINRTTFNNIDLLDMFKGVDETVAGIRIGTISGEEVVKLITENVKNNLKSKTRNPILQWSDFRVNKTLISDILNGKSNKDYSDAISFRSPKTGEYEPIDVYKGYCILMSDKYLIKDTKNIKFPAQIRDKFVKIDESYDILFKRYLDMVDRKVVITDDIRKERII